jgi:hypothetical protein
VARRTSRAISPTAARLRLLRTSILGESATAFARRLNISVNRLSNLEIASPLSIDVAHKIRAAVPGITLDWLYYGDERALPISVVDQLRTRAEPTEEPR